MEVKSALSFCAKKPRLTLSQRAQNQTWWMMPELADGLMLVLLMGCFAIAFVYAYVCNGVLGPTAGREASS